MMYSDALGLGFYLGFASWAVSKVISLFLSIGGD